MDTIARALTRKERDERFAPTGTQGTTRQVWGHSLGLSNELFPVAYADRSANIGFAVYGGEIKMTNLKVTDWDGNVLLNEDFSRYADGAVPVDAAWEQHCGAGGEFHVETDPTAPNTAHKCIHQPSRGEIWSWLLGKSAPIPADNRFIIDVDILPVGGPYCFTGPAWYVTKKVEGVEAYYYAEETASARNYFRSVKAGAPETEIRNRRNEGALEVGVWQHFRIAVDQANFKVHSTYRGDTVLAPRDYLVVSNRFTVFDNRRDDVVGPGSLESIFLTMDGSYIQQTIDIYVDDDVTPRLSMPVREFLGGGLPATTNNAYFTRYQGQLSPLEGQIVCGNWRSVHIPYEHTLRVEMSSNDPVGTPQLCWVGAYFRRGKVPHDYPQYRPQYKTKVADPQEWVPIYEIADKAGRLHYIYLEIEGDAEGFMDGSMRIWVDGEVVWQSDAGEDAFFHCFYGDRTGICTGDMAGMVHKSNEAGPIYKRSFYRYFILDPVFFNDSLKVEFQNGQDCGVTVPTATWRTFCEVYTK